MIRLVSDLPDISGFDAGYLKIKCLYDSFRFDNRVLFWRQQGGAYISLSGGNMTISGGAVYTEELFEFLSLISPSSVFCPEDTAIKLKNNYTAVNVMRRLGDISGETVGDRLSSDELYKLFDIPDFSLPPYPEFAVDWCRRLNRGCAEYYGIKEKCAALSFNSGNYALINGIVSKEKGYGKKALTAIIQKNRGKYIIACCEDRLTGYYEKYGFEKLSKRFAIINEYE